jgi:hypothetical protein
MTIEDFIATLKEEAPPKVSVSLTAMWFDAKGRWNEAHELAQDDTDFCGAWVHAYLHRKEGDFNNADYWYRRAGRPAFAGSIENEWRDIVLALLV